MTGSGNPRGSRGVAVTRSRAIQVAATRPHEISTRQPRRRRDSSTQRRGSISAPRGAWFAFTTADVGASRSIMGLPALGDGAIKAGWNILTKPWLLPQSSAAVMTSACKSLSRASQPIIDSAFAVVARASATLTVTTSEESARRAARARVAGAGATAPRASKRSAIISLSALLPQAPPSARETPRKGARPAGACLCCVWMRSALLRAGGTWYVR